MSRADGHDVKADDAPLVVGLRPLLRIKVHVLPAVILDEHRRCVPFAGGEFWGPGSATGVVLEGGADWQRIRSDGTVEISACYALRTHDGDTVEVRSRGLRHAPLAVAEQLARGESVDPAEYYFRTHITFTTTAARLERLNRVLGVATGRRDPDAVHVHVQEVL